MDRNTSHACVLAGTRGTKTGEPIPETGKGTELEGVSVEISRNWED